MRTYNESFINGNADNNDVDLRNRNFNFNLNNNNNNNNNNSNNTYSHNVGKYINSYESSHYSQTLSNQNQNISNNNINNGAIPYHARENSLPFSYGQIGKTSTPLKSAGGVGAGNVSNGGSGGNYGYNIGNGNSYMSGVGSNGYDANYGLNGGSRNVSDNYRKMVNGNDSDTDASTIKAEPRLKSPLLVRKTLSGHSPTHGGTTNTISNTYHYSYGNSNGNGRLSPSTNGNVGNFYTTTTRQQQQQQQPQQRTPTRTDFEDLLRERREKVFSEYRDTTKTARQIDSESVLPPPRQFRGEDSTDGVYATPRNRKYNYDFEFHLNLDDDWTSPYGEGGVKIPPKPPVRRTSSNAMDHYSNTFSKREQFQREQYRTRDIELPALGSRDLERSYHTLNSTNSGTSASPYKESQWNNSFGRDARYFETYEQRRQQTQSMPQPQLIEQQQRAEYTTTTTYGNGNSPGYGSQNNNGSINHNNGSINHNNGSINHNNNSINNSSHYFKNHNHHNVTENAFHRSQLDSAAPKAATAAASQPIYATTMKQQVVKSVNMASPTTPTTPLFTRPETPAFPVTPRTPFGTLQNGYSPSTRRLDHSLSNGNGQSQHYSSETMYHLTSPRSRLNSSVSAEPQEVAAHLVKFAKDSSKFWYKPNLGRDEAISLLLNAPPGTFLVRDSTTYKNAYGLVLRVSQPPPNSNATGKPDELVRHFLIEPTTRGVRLKGCTNEPVFTSLSALVYEHSINQLALPCLLRIPEQDLAPPLVEPTAAQRQLLSQGAACNVLWIYSCDTESLTGEEAIRKAIRQLYAQKPLPSTTEVHFKVSQQGITLTDNTRTKFFRKHYAADMISFCALDPDHRLWTIQESTSTENEKATNANVGMKKTIFAFVARRSPSSKDNQCHVFCDLAINQPASAIVSFANKTLPTDRQRNFVL